jgi:hypothetical protein
MKTVADMRDMRWDRMSRRVHSYDPVLPLIEEDE